LSRVFSGQENMGRRRRRKLRATPGATNVGHTAVGLVEWFRSHRDGARLPGPPLRLASFPETGRGLMALSPLSPNDILIAIPLRFLVTRAKAEAALSASGAGNPDLSTHHLISAFLLRELDRGSGSFWRPYLETLPECYDVPFFCATPETEAMPGYVREKWLEQQKTVADAFQLVVDGLRVSADLPRFAWAWFAVNTRAVYFDNGDAADADVERRSRNNLALAPFLDMFNHSAGISVRVSVEPSPAFPEGVYQIASAGTSYKRHDQVFINYGPHDNLKLCFEYGFVLDDNADDLVPVSFGDLASGVCKNSSDGRLLKAAHFLRSQGLDKHLGIVAGPEVGTWNLLATVFVLGSLSKPEAWCPVFKTLASAETCTTKYYLLFYKKRLPGVGSKPGSFQFNLFSHFHHFAAEPQRLPKQILFAYFKSICRYSCNV
jgi:hypothetical protein